MVRRSEPNPAFEDVQDDEPTHRRRLRQLRSRASRTFANACWAVCLTLTLLYLLACAVLAVVRSSDLSRVPSQAAEVVAWLVPLFIVCCAVECLSRTGGES